MWNCLSWAQQIELAALSPDTKNSSIYWAQLSMFHVKTETEPSIRNVLFYMKDRAMNNVQNCYSYVRLSFAEACMAVKFKASDLSASRVPFHKISQWSLLLLKHLFFDITSRSPLKVNRRLEVTNSSIFRVEVELCSEDSGCILFRNVGWISTNYTVLCYYYYCYWNWVFIRW
jgi:hypothetical protein